MKKWLLYVIPGLLIVLMYSMVFAVGESIDTRMQVQQNVFNSPIAGKGYMIIEIQLKSYFGAATVTDMTNAVQLDAVLDAQFRANGSLYTIIAVNNSSGDNSTTSDSYTQALRQIQFVFNSKIWTVNNSTWTPVAELTIFYTMIGNTGTVNWSPDTPDYSIGGAGLTTGSETPIDPFQWGTQDIPLPVELTAFKAANTQNGVKLTWNTQSENNLAGFNLWKSKNADAGFEKINPSLINAAGSSTNPVEYTFDDNNVENDETWFYRLEQVELDGTSTFISSIQVEVSKLPATVFLHQNFPNPFNPSTEIQFDIPEESFVRLSVFNVLGEEIRTLVNEVRSAGIQTVVWDGLDNNNHELGSGIYFYKLVVGDVIQFHKMIKVE